MPTRVQPAKPLVIFCHGERLSHTEIPFKKTHIPVGFFAAIGHGISSWASFDIFHGSQTPAEWPDYLPDLRLTPLTPTERKVSNRLQPATYPHPIQYLDKEMHLGNLIDENATTFTEIWLLCCTMTVPGLVNQIDTGILGIKMDVPHNLSMVGEKEAGEALRDLVAKRKKSEAAAFLSGLGGVYVRYYTLREPGPAIVAEWQISLLPPVTDDPASWLETVDIAYDTETIAYLMKPPPDLPDLGADFRKRVQVMWASLDGWPKCVPTVKRIRDEKAKSMANLWRFCARHPSVQRFEQKVARLDDRGKAWDPGNLDTWEAYLTEYAAAVVAEPEAVPLVVDHAGFVGAMTHYAKGWIDFTAVWKAIKGDPAVKSVVTLLRAESVKDAGLAEKIKQAEA
ncbi:MAG TPA: hypothetical protein VGX25_27405 [Actinophytocola sp.]|uniref:hypothetical protein n=1 Tax=Actinophytocola sp. TaxID=1872138 RepID=UPI002DDCFDE0|nr:hypothetical protein [Actinophytocola sp.]HEV2783126.1 hypothetical protein [Actinophytocola sp.]